MILPIALLIAAAPALLVDPKADEGQPCAAHAALDGALRSRLPGIRVEDATAPAAGDLRVTLRSDEGAWELLLRRDDGQVALRRRLAFGPQRCSLLADTAALVIDRYLEEIRWSGRPAAIAPLPAPPRLPDIGPPPAAPPPEVILPQRLPPHAPPRPHVEIGAGPAAWLGLASDWRAALLLEGHAPLGNAVRAGVVLLGTTGSAQTVGRGSVDVRSGLIALSLDACTRDSGPRLCAGPLAGGRASAGSASGNIFRTSNSTIWQPELGLRGSADLAVGAGFSLGVEALGLFALGSASFAVEDENLQRRSLSAIDLVLALRIGWSGF